MFASASVFVATSLITLPQRASAITGVSNLTQTNSGSGTNVTYQSGFGADMAEAFTTGASAATLNSITVRMLTASGGGGFSVQLYSNVGDSPGTSLITLSGNTNPATAGDYTYTGSFALAPSATYWVFETVTQSAPNKVYTWSETASNSETGISGWTIRDGFKDRSQNNGVPGAWFNDVGSPFQLSVDVTVVPEPGTWAMVLGGIGMLVGFRRFGRVSNP
ncbi:MAG: hypothetical protein QOD99_2176 [Chthoniobacter sp.]|nr:hypothetical protein [Chthoniobacter sp.]